MGRSRMVQGHRRGWGWLSASVVAATLSWACSGNEAPAVDANFVHIYDGLPPAAFEAPSAEDSRLIGPGYDIEIIGVSVNDTFFGAVGSTTVDDDYQAPEGHDLVAARLTPAMSSLSGTSAQLQAEVLVGDDARPLDSVPKGGNTIVVAAPEGAAVRLAVTDDEAGVQSIDLRTGERGADAVAGFYRDVSQELGWTYRRTGTVTGLPLMTDPTLDLAVEITLDVAHLQPWVEEPGYAPEDRAWLTIDASGTATGEAASLNVPVGFSAEDAFSLVDESGEASRALPAILVLDAGLTSTTLVFDVPDTFTTGTLHISPGASALLDATTGSPNTSSWVTPPNDGEVPIELIEGT